MPNRQRKRVSVLRRLLGRGVSLSAACQQIGLSKSQTWRLANRWRLPRRRRDLDVGRRRRLRRLLQRGDLRQAEIARRLGVSPSTVCRHRQALVAHVGGGQTIRLRHPRTCAECGGRVLVWPCLACQIGQR